MKSPILRSNGDGPAWFWGEKANEQGEDHVGEDMMTYQKVVVTGARGQLGQALCRMLGPVAIPADLPEIDITSKKHLHAFLKSVTPAAIINTAAFTRVDAAEDQPELARAINALAVGYLAEYCRQTGCVLVQVSTDYVFGGDTSRTIPYQEDDPPAPINVYGRTKWEGELEAARTPRHIIVRTCGLYGELGPNSPGNFVETILKKAQRGETLRVVNDQVCSPSYVPHVARAIMFLMNKGYWGIFHVVNGGQTTWYRLAQKIVELAGFHVPILPITSAEYPARARRPHYSVLDSSKYRTLEGAPPLPHWEEAIHEFLMSRKM